MNILNKNILGKKFPPLLIHLYYFFIACTFCYIYLQKFISEANFNSACDGGSIYAVITGIACKPVQFSVLIPFLFKFLLIITFLKDKLLFVLISIIITYFILLSFYLLLNCYFKSKAHNCWLAPIIIYPMIWNYVILNGQFFFIDFFVLLVIILGFYFIVTGKFLSLLILLFIGTLNHLSSGYLIIAYLIYNYKNILKQKVVIYTLAMLIVYISVYYILNEIYRQNAGYFIIYFLQNNIMTLKHLSVHIFLRDMIFNFGGLHIFLILYFVSGEWKKFKGPMLYINYTVIPCILIVFIFFTMNDMRNYISGIPFILIGCLLYLSNSENSFLKPVDKLLQKN